MRPPGGRVVATPRPRPCVQGYEPHHQLRSYRLNMANGSLGTKASRRVHRRPDLISYLKQKLRQMRIVRRPQCGPASGKMQVRGQSATCGNEGLRTSSARSADSRPCRWRYFACTSTTFHAYDVSEPHPQKSALACPEITGTCG